MAARSIASLSLSFGLVSIPVKLYSATESSTAIRFKLMAAGGRRLTQQYVAEPTAASPSASLPGSAPVPTAQHESAPTAGQALRAVSSERSASELRAQAAMPEVEDKAPATPDVIERSDMVKGYEFEKGKFVLFTADELKALADSSRQTIDIVAFMPQAAVDPIFFDKAYFLAPDKRGGKPYNLLLKAMRTTGRCAIAKWAYRAKEYVVQIRPADGGMVLQQLLYADEVRSLSDLDIELAEVGDAELKLATQLIDQISVDSYEPTQYVDEEKQRILAAVEAKIVGQKIVAPGHAEPAAGGQVVDLMNALRASLKKAPEPAVTMAVAATSNVMQLGARKPVRRAAKKAKPEATIAKDVKKSS